MLSVSKEASSTIFWVFGMTRRGIEPRSPGPLANTLTAKPMEPFKLFFFLTIISIAQNLNKEYARVCVYVCRKYVTKL